MLFLSFLGSHDSHDVVLSLSLSFSVVFEWLRFDQSSIGDVLLNVSERNFIVASLYYYF